MILLVGPSRKMNEAAAEFLKESKAMGKTVLKLQSSCPV